MSDLPDDLPPIGNDPLPGQKPHIWQEFERDRQKPKSWSAPILGRGWPIVFVPILLILFHLHTDTDATPASTSIIKQIF